MKKLSQSEIIYEYLEEHYPEWHNGYEFVNRYVIVKGQSYWCGSSADRLARKLAIEEKIDRKREGKYVQYRAKIKDRIIPSPLSKQMNFTQENVKIKV